jgi:hypothetical protein
MEALRQWLLEVANCVESGSSELALVHANIPRELYEEPDERQSVLASEALKTLPMPMQTLLKALEALKKDIAIDLVKQRFNQDSAENAVMESNAAYCSKALQACASDISLVVSQGISAFHDASLEASVKSLIHESQGPRCWASELGALLRSLLEKQTLLLKETTAVKYTKRLSLPFNSTESLQAIEQSSTLRDRLQELSSGDLTRLYKPIVQTRVDHPEQSAPVAIIEPKHSEAALTECIETIRTTRALLRRVRQALDGIVRTQAVDIDDCKKTLIIGLQRTRFETKPRHEVVPTDMATVDSALQEEIRLLLQTISVDRAALDLALRNIKTKCTIIQQSARAEASMTRAILMKRLQMQITDAFETFVHATQLY